MNPIPMRGDIDTSEVRIVLALPLAIALAASNLGCSPEVPATPTYTNDVRPILMAHCVRCHGADDMFNTNPDVPGLSSTRRETVTCSATRTRATVPTAATDDLQARRRLLRHIEGTESLIISRV